MASKVIWGKTLKTTPIPSAFKDFRVFEMTGDALVSKIQAVNIRMPMGRLDNKYYCTDEEGWKVILQDLVTNSSLYVAEKFDCDKYAMKARVIAFERYGLNTCGFIIGDAPFGRHSWNLIVTPTGFLMFEPQYDVTNWGVFPIGGRGYIPDMVLM
jgi:hypothetical protein